MADGRLRVALAAVLAVFLHVLLLRLWTPVVLRSQPATQSGEFTLVDAVVVRQPDVMDPAAGPEAKPAEPNRLEPSPEASLEIEENRAAIMDETPQTPEQVKSVPQSAPDTGAFVPFYRVDLRPAFLYKAPLEYPRNARRQNLEGTVIVEADIDRFGILVRARVVKKAGFGFDEEALEMIRESRFEPAYSSGQPVPVRMRFTIVFTLG